MYTKERVILATDGLSLRECLELTQTIGNLVYAVKIHDLYDLNGPETVKMLHEAGAQKVWVDHKLHDIPKTVQYRADAIIRSGADILTVHASGGIEMMMAAYQGIVELFAVTVLTSLTEEETTLLYGLPPKPAVINLARMAKLARVHGIVCSPQEVGILHKRPEFHEIRFGPKFIVPGVRSPGVDVGDQKRVDTPANAIKSGASHIVVGRQLTTSPNPMEALNKLEEEISQVFKEGGGYEIPKR